MALEIRTPRRKAKRKEQTTAESSQWILEPKLPAITNEVELTIADSEPTKQPRKKRRQQTRPDVPTAIEPIKKRLLIEDAVDSEGGSNASLNKPSPLLQSQNSPSLQNENYPVEQVDIPVQIEDSPFQDNTIDTMSLEDTYLQANSAIAVDMSQSPSLGVHHNISMPHSTRILPTKKPLPSDEVVNTLFSKLLDNLNLQPEQVAEMNMMSLEQKWTLILAQEEKSSESNCMYYVDQLVRHTQPVLKEKKIKRKALENLQPLKKLLKELDVQLRTSTENWVIEFVTAPCHGHIALIDLLKDLIEYPGLLNMTQKYEVLQRSPALVHMVLVCVKIVMSNRQGFNAIINYVPSIYAISHCITFPHNKTKSLVLKLLISVFLVPGGSQKVLQAFDHFQRIKGEHHKFEILVNSMFQEPVDRSYQKDVFRFINTVVQSANGLNYQIFYQQQFVNAGLNIKDLKQSQSGELNEGLEHEIKEWDKSFIDVQQLTDDYMISRGRAKGLKQELDMTLKSLREARVERDNYYDYSVKILDINKKQKAKIASMAGEITDLIDQQHERTNLIKRIGQLEEINEQFRDQTSELKKKLTAAGAEMLLDLKIDPAMGLQEQIELMKSFKTSTIGTQTDGSVTLSEDGEQALEAPQDTEASPEEPADIPEPPPLPPIPAPPPLPGTAPIPPPFPSESGLTRKPCISNLPLPSLNWTPLRNVEQTIFDGLNDEALIEEIDFSEFEELFQVIQLEKKKKTKKPAEKKIELFEQKRSREIVFVKRRVKKDANDISELVMNIDLDGLVAEQCELLLQIVPSETECELLEKNAKDYPKLGEAEQYLFELAKIARLEERLSVMTFIGTFDEMYQQTQPKVEAVLSGSMSIFRSSRLKKVLELILAFGNYMNSSKRGVVSGFRLSSLQKLSDTKSTDKKQHLLHYITSIAESIYPGLISFYEELDIDDACEVSLEMIEADITSIKLGLKSLQEEQASDPNNFILFNFSRQVTHKVEDLLESFQKMKDAYTEVCLMFGESPKEEPEVFFGYFRSFIKSWRVAVNDNKKRKKRKSISAVVMSGKQGQHLNEKPENILRALASEAAIIASSRMKKIREETSKLQTQDGSHGGDGNTEGTPTIEETEKEDESNPLKVFQVQLKKTAKKKTEESDYDKNIKRKRLTDDSKINELLDDDYYSLINDI